MFLYTILAAWLCLSVYHLPACILHPAAMCWIISRACLVDSLVDTSVHEFLCFTSMGAISSCGLLVIPACYLMTSRTYLGLISTTQLASQHLSYLLEIFGSDWSLYHGSCWTVDMHLVVAILFFSLSVCLLATLLFSSDHPPFLGNHLVLWVFLKKLLHSLIEIDFLNSFVHKYFVSDIHTHLYSDGCVREHSIVTLCE